MARRFGSRISIFIFGCCVWEEYLLYWWVMCINNLMVNRRKGQHKQEVGVGKGTGSDNRVETELVNNKWAEMKKEECISNWSDRGKFLQLVYLLTVIQGSEGVHFLQFLIFMLLCRHCLETGNIVTLVAQLLTPQ